MQTSEPSSLSPLPPTSASAAPSLQGAPWRLAPQAEPGLTAAIAQAAGLSPTVAAIVARRTGSLEAARAWLAPESAPLCDPFALGGMRATVERLKRAIAVREPITVFGDYDTDGITATALLTQALLRMGAVAKPFFPDRATEGYGLTPGAVARCLTYAPRPTLVVTVDCGITCVDEVAWLRAQGVETLITDHHTPPERLPEAVAIVNPRLSAPPGAEGMCGCATAFTLVRALAEAGVGEAPEDFLDLVAVATVADVMMLTGENRALVARGLRALGAARGNAGLRALMRDLRLPTGAALTAERIAFGLVPCVNAAGRLGRLKDAWALIGLGREAHAKALRAANEERRALERMLAARLEARLPERVEGALVLGGEDFHPGVVGIVAARLMERVGVPVALVCRTPDGGGHGSMRAGDGWHAVAALDSVRDLLGHYGGHAAAAGFTLLPGAYDAFCRRLPKAFAGAREETPPPEYDADLAHVPITLALCRELTCLEPCGHGNPRPCFRKGFTLESCRPVGADGTHLSLRLRPDDGGEALKAIWFGAADRAKGWHPGMPLHALFTLDIDTFREPCPSLRLLDVMIP